MIRAASRRPSSNAPMTARSAEARAFQTSSYQGAWFSFSGDRHAFRDTLQTYLRQTLSDPEGTLLVDSNGPHWLGKHKIDLSYSHTGSFAVAVFSETMRVGVDVEKSDRIFKEDPVAIARRFFHVNEIETLSKTEKEELNSSFLALWVKKEAYAKLTRAGLKDSIRLELEKQDFSGEPLPVTPAGHIAFVAYAPPSALPMPSR